MAQRLTLAQTKELREKNKKKFSAASAKPLTLEETKSNREKSAKPSDVPLLVGNQYFDVYFGSTRISFIRVSNVQQAAEHEDLAEGGLNGFTHVLGKPQTQSGTLTLEKGVVDDESIVKIMKALSPGTHIRVPVTILLCRREGAMSYGVRGWGFDEGVVTRWEVSNLDGLGSEIAIEKLEISHSGLVELEV